MEYRQDVQQWAEAMFGNAALGDQRRTRRLVHTAVRIAEQPEGSLPSKLDWNELRGAYGLMHRPEATPAAIAGPHFQQVHARMRQQPLVLIVHDTTELDFTSHRALRGTGPTGGGTTRGFLQHNSLALLPSGELLGLAHQQLTVRQPVPAGETAAQRRQRRRESHLWLDGVQALGEAPAGCTWVDIMDRGGDLFDAMDAARRLGHHFLIRVAQNRKVLLGPPGQPQTGYLLTYARQLAPQATSTVPITSRGGRPAREAAVALAAAEVWLSPPWPEAKRKDARPPLRVWVERVWEPAPPAGTQPLEWVLVSSLPIETTAELQTRQAWYGLRWPTAEDFHQVEKTGCGEEKLRFETAEAMAPMLSLLSVVAVRILQLRSAERCHPAAPASWVASAVEQEVVAAGSQGRVSVATMTVRQFVHEVARLGGFLGRRGDGSPGWKTLWRGYQRLQERVVGYTLAPGARPELAASDPPRRTDHPRQKCW